SVRASRPGYGPAATLSAPAIATGRVLSTRGMNELIARAASRLRTYASVRSVFACASVTPGFRLTIISAQSQEYRPQYSTDDPPGWWPPNVVIGMNTVGALPSETPTNPS